MNRDGRHPFALALLSAWMGIGCGGPIPPLEAPSPAPADSPLNVADGGVSLLASMHLMTVTKCAKAPSACASLAHEGATINGFKVAFGGASGTVRSREQAMADLYRELRDRTSLGSRLSATSRLPEHAVLETGGIERTSQAGSSAASADPLTDAAFELLGAAETDGELVLDVARDRATCKVALASAPIDAGHAAHSHCLVKGPERPGGYLDPPSAQEREHERDHSVGQ